MFLDEKHTTIHEIILQKKKIKFESDETQVHKPIYKDYRRQRNEQITGKYKSRLRATTEESMFLQQRITQK